MPKLPQISGAQLVRALKREGWREKNQEGSHLKLVKYDKPQGKSIVIVPMHKVLKKGTLSGILKDAYLTKDKLIELL